MRWLDNVNTRFRNYLFLILVTLSTLMHSEHMNKDLMSIHVWRQTQTYSTAVNFYEEDMNILNPRRNERGNTEGYFRMEFPLMQWLTACLFKVFGNQVWVARWFMFAIGLLTVFGMFRFLLALFRNEWMATLGTWAFNFSPSFYYYTINPLPDNMALCFGIWGLAIFLDQQNRQRESNAPLIFSGILLSLAALCKLPYVIFFIFPVSVLIRDWFSKSEKPTQFVHLISLSAPALAPLAWYVWVIPQWPENPVVSGIFGNKESLSKLLDFYRHNLISTLPELLLNYGSTLFFLAGFYFLFKRKAYRSQRFLPLLALSAVVLVYYLYEASALGYIHDYYLFPFYPLLFALVAYGAWQFYHSGKAFNRVLSILAFAILPLTCFLRMEVRWNPEDPGFNRDLLIHKEDLRKAIPKDALVVVGNDESHFISYYYIDKKGWGFHDDNLSAEDLQKMIDSGAKYLYCDSEQIWNDPRISELLDQHILEAGSYKVFKLKQ